MRDWAAGCCARAAGRLEAVRPDNHLLGASNRRRPSAKTPGSGANAKRFEALLEEVGKSSDAYLLAEMEVARGELHAWVAFAEGRGDDAVRAMRDAADRQDATGKGEVEIPAREMLADILLELGRPADALAEYERSMTIDPNRFNALFGAATAAEKTENRSRAQVLHASRRELQGVGLFTSRTGKGEAVRSGARFVAVGREGGPRASLSGPRAPWQQ